VSDPGIVVGVVACALAAWDVGRRYVQRIQFPQELAEIRAHQKQIDESHSRLLAEVMKTKAAVARGNG